MKTLSPARLDQDTPKWPEVRITLGDSPTVTVSGVITPVADEPAAITRCAEQARALGRPIRARVTTADGALRRLIVSPPATSPRSPHREPPRQAAPKRTHPPRKTPGRKDNGLLARFPPASAAADPLGRTRDGPAGRGCPWW